MLFESEDTVYEGKIISQAQLVSVKKIIIIIMAELAERSPIIIKNGSSNPSSQKKLDL